MKVMKKIIFMGIAVLLLVAAPIAAFAAEESLTPAELVAELTGREVQSIIDERFKSSKSYGSIAKEAGVLDSFRARILEIQKVQLAARVAEGKMTREQADAILAGIEAHRANCDGSGGPDAKLGPGGQGNGQGCGQGDQGRGQCGRKGARGAGNCLRNGSCGSCPKH